uniref:NADH dehydrogenase subunit 6 n=1 Tax=Myladina unguiculina TaxID=3037634 RepID=UPI0024354145|nr:NADH dehydrogenase subunit 6 [Myladina unguiculina]WEX49729.1 NADH dehydrogenase subunit 6 [Myladina unguiculina]
MLSIMFTINMLMSLIFLTMTHPLSMGLILLIQTIMVSLISGNYNFNYWYSYILFLILIGGMLVLFMYMTSIASNEKFMFNMKYLMLSPFIVMPLILPYFNIELNLMNNETMMFTMNKIINTSLNKYINFPLNILLMFTIIYLLLALIATVKITNFKKGPVRQMN